MNANASEAHAPRALPSAFPLLQPIVAVPPERGTRLQAHVLQCNLVTPHMRRITLGGPDVAAFLRHAAADQPGAWVKVFVPGGEGRAYTLRRIDRVAATLDLDFVLHGDSGHEGPASAWAARAQPGECISFAGPRDGGFALPDDARWVMLAGDATALPAIQSIAASLGPEIRLKTYVEVPSAADVQEIRSQAVLRTCWLTGDPAEPGLALQQQLMHRPQPAGPGYIWLAGESGVVRTLRAHFLNDQGLARTRLTTKGYWKHGEADHRDRA